MGNSYCVGYNLEKKNQEVCIFIQFHMDHSINWSYPKYLLNLEQNHFIESYVNHGFSLVVYV